MTIPPYRIVRSSNPNMSEQPRSKVTQVMERPSLPASLQGDGTLEIIKLIEQGEETRRIYQAIVECIGTSPGVEGCVIFLPAEKAEQTREIVARHGSHLIEASHGDFDSHGDRALQSAGLGAHKITEGAFTYFDIVCLGASIGSIVVYAPRGITKPVSDKIRYLAHHTGVAYERQRLTGTVQIFLDRLEVLNELNQLIAGNVGLQRIVKSIARESAFRFAADVTITWIFDEAKENLEPKGGYGCSPQLLPKKVDLSEGILAEALRHGGNLCVSSLKSRQNHNLQFLEDLGIVAVHICCLEVRGETLGALLIGYKREVNLSNDDLTRFEEFCQGAAVAISNARTQERITSYTERLEELVESRTADLAIQTARAEEANLAKSQFLANMSHELRTPLTAIVGYSSVLCDGIFGPLNDKQREALTAVTRSSDHLKNLIDDVLNLARIESGKEQAEPTRVSLKELLNQAYKLMLQTAVSKGVSLTPLDLPPEIQDTALWVDQKHIHQIIINLMSNAVKYTPKGGKVWVNASIVVDKIKISVSDTGVGIPPHKIAKLFERFERGEDTYSKSQEGTGIGLDLTKRLIELNGGRIGVESEEGNGSTFWVLLPLAAFEKSSAGTTVSKVEMGETRARLDGLSTLIVDDNQDTLDVLQQILISAGATVRAANSVREGLAHFKESPPDIVLTDLAIPGESGIVLIESIRSGSGAAASIPIIVLSACAFEADKDAALNAGASLFIPKPFKPHEIVRNVRNLTLSMAMHGNPFAQK